VQFELRPFVPTTTTKAYYSIAWNISYLAAAIYLVGSEKKGEVDWLVDSWSRNNALVTRLK
jgi:hypothetical protein